MGKEVRIGGDKHSLNSSQSPASSCDGDGNGDIINGGAIGCHIDEIPIWVHGEQRWISGITKETTCAQLVDALLRDQGLKAAKENGSCSSGGSSNAVTTDHMGNQYVITERWKRVEQVLDQRTRILKIWEAWGETKPEVRLCLRRVDHSKLMANQNHNNHIADYDSGRESPTDGASSAIVRRKRHRTSKSSPAWVTHAQTIHPKSSKTTIEKLMKLILEQGETIQQQLTKLRDREHQISKLEEDRHRVRERKHGKNYLLETYLNGLHEADDKEIATGNSDSGVHTENATPSPEVSASPVQHSDDIANECFELTEETRAMYVDGRGGSRRKTISEREAKLIKEHESRKEFCDAQKDSIESGEGSDVGGAVGGMRTDTDNIAGQIELLEKVVAINKHIQREEELLVRLNAKIRKCESDNPALTEDEIMVALDRVNGDIATANVEMEKMEHELDASNDMLSVKTDIVNQLSRELEALELLSTGLPCAIDATNLIQIHTEPKSETLLDVAAGPSRASASAQMSGDAVTQHYPHATNFNGRDNVLSEQINFYKNMLPDPNTFSSTPMSMPQHYIVPDHVVLNQVPRFFQKDDGDASNGTLSNARVDQRNINSNATTMAKCVKIGPKKLMMGLCKDPDSDTGISSLGEDATQLGTLV